MEINIKSIPVKQLIERYKVFSAGDYWRTAENTVQIRVADLRNPNMEFLIALHELVEEWLCNKRGIKETDIQKFDIEHSHLFEPGNEPDAPYYNEHQVATIIEMIMCRELDIKWSDYDEAIGKIGV